MVQVDNTCVVHQINQYDDEEANIQAKDAEAQQVVQRLSNVATREMPDYPVLHEAPFPALEPIVESESDKESEVVNSSSCCCIQ